MKFFFKQNLLSPDTAKVKMTVKFTLASAVLALYIDFVTPEEQKLFYFLNPGQPIKNACGGSIRYCQSDIIYIIYNYIY